MDDFIPIGEIIKSRGLKGELKIKPATNNINRLKGLKAVWIDTVPFDIVSSNAAQPFVYFKLSGIDNRSQADIFKNKLIWIKKEDADPLEDGDFYIADLVGCVFEAEESGLVLLKGKVIEIHQHGAADVFEIELDTGKKFMFPFLNRLNLKIDIANKRISADRRLLDEVAVYG